MSYKSSQTEQTSPHYDQILHLHLNLVTLHENNFPDFSFSYLFDLKFEFHAQVAFPIDPAHFCGQFAVFLASNS